MVTQAQTRLRALPAQFIGVDVKRGMEAYDIKVPGSMTWFVLLINDHDYEAHLRHAGEKIDLDIMSAVMHPGRYEEEANLRAAETLVLFKSFF